MIRHANMDPVLTGAGQRVARGATTGGCYYAWLPRAVADAMTPRLSFLAAFLRVVGGRTLPAKNELANACYFTYRVGYVICDTSLGPAEAQKEMEAGRCNEDFRLMGSDFQRLVTSHYVEGARPPFEEAMWLLTSPDHFQSRTLSECPPMQILANFLYAEALLFMDGSSRFGESAALVAHAMSQLRDVQHEVLEALGRTWPLDLAKRKFEEHFLSAEEARRQEARSNGLQASIVMCRCGLQSLTWLTELFPENAAVQIFLYDTCGPSQKSWGLPEVLSAADFKQKCAREPDVVEAKDVTDCPVELILQHLLKYGSNEAAFLLFLPSLPPVEYEQQLYTLVVRSLARRMLRADFVQLGHTRSSPKALNSCQRAVLSEAGIHGHVSGYESPRFVVSAERISASLPRARVVLLALETATECTGQAWEDIMRGLWHTVFGEAALLPTRADNVQIPIFLRVLDGPSGFAKTRMPKSSDYLDWAATALLET
ncbi:unnamed protein product [Symbiodinium sp. CCMP2456]|nr:unnamed protein product [Symbiodinium sp. CCMP2456]